MDIGNISLLQLQYWKILTCFNPIYPCSFTVCFDSIPFPSNFWHLASSFRFHTLQEITTMASSSPISTTATPLSPRKGFRIKCLPVEEDLRPVFLSVFTADKIGKHIDPGFILGQQEWFVSQDGRTGWDTPAGNLAHGGGVRADVEPVYTVQGNTLIWISPRSGLVTTLSYHSATHNTQRNIWNQRKREAATQPNIYSI